MWRLITVSHKDTIPFYSYHPQTKLQQGNVFTGLSLFTGGGVGGGLMSFPVWSLVPSGGVPSRGEGVCLGGGGVMFGKSDLLVMVFWLKVTILAFWLKVAFCYGLLVYPILPNTDIWWWTLKRAVCIVLECILVGNCKLHQHRDGLMWGDLIA